MALTFSKHDFKIKTKAHSGWIITLMKSGWSSAHAYTTEQEQPGVLKAADRGSDGTGQRSRSALIQPGKDWRVAGRRGGGGERWEGLETRSPAENNAGQQFAVAKGMVTRTQLWSHLTTLLPALIHSQRGHLMARKGQRRFVIIKPLNVFHRVSWGIIYPVGLVRISSKNCKILHLHHLNCNITMISHIWLYAQVLMVCLHYCCFIMATIRILFCS